MGSMCSALMLGLTAAGLKHGNIRVVQWRASTRSVCLQLFSALSGVACRPFQHQSIHTA
ncbi:hypothetical protein IG631_08317 [Alternaria alternata]|nr:hypothetical protein IG631_08317 [Alternaria alternata]